MLLQNITFVLRYIKHFYDYLNPKLEKDNCIDICDIQMNCVQEFHCRHLLSNIVADYHKV